MDAFKPLCQVWHEQVKQFFTKLHGHQSKVLAMFVLGAIKAESIVIQKVAEALLAESEAKAPSIERRLERFLSNERIETEKTWDDLLEQVMPYFRRGPMRLGSEPCSSSRSGRSHAFGPLFGGLVAGSFSCFLYS